MRSPLYLGIVDEHNDSLDGEGLLASSRLSIADAYQGFGVVRTHVFFLSVEFERTSPSRQHRPAPIPLIQTHCLPYKPADTYGVLWGPMGSYGVREPFSPMDNKKAEA